jgi:hypothetical protein
VRFFSLSLGIALWTDHCLEPGGQNCGGRKFIEVEGPEAPRFIDVETRGFIYVETRRFIDVATCF